MPTSPVPALNQTLRAACHCLACEADSVFLKYLIFRRSYQPARHHTCPTFCVFCIYSWPQRWYIGLTCSSDNTVALTFSFIKYLPVLILKIDFGHFTMNSVPELLALLSPLHQSSSYFASAISGITSTWALLPETKENLVHP